MKELTIISQNSDFVSSSLEYESYVLVQSRTIEQINGQSIKETSDLDLLQGYVKIKSGDKIAYRKCRGNSNVKKGEIAIGYRTMAELKARIGSQVQIEPVGHFCFYWYSSDQFIKYSFRIGVIGLILTIISAIISIFSLFIDFPICI